MSKSLGNVVNPFELVRRYGTDPVRYYLLREISSTEDGDFTQEKFENRYNADLANGLGNLVARVLTLAAKHKTPAFAPASASAEAMADKPAGVMAGKQNKNQKFIDKIWKNEQKFLDEFKFNEALAEIWKLISFCDKTIDKERPWEKSKNQLSVINDLLFTLENIAQMLEPFLPQTSEKILRQLQQGKSEPLFPRIKNTKHKHFQNTNKTQNTKT